MKDRHYITVYHGSDVVVEKSDLTKSNEGKDFGKGFYVTTDKQQAIKFAHLIARRNGSTTCYVNEYKLYDFTGVLVYTFKNTDKDWLNCVIGNREKKYIDLAIPWNKYEVLIGKVADDTTSLVINAYMAEAYGKPGSPIAVRTAISQFKTIKLKDQICLKTDKALSILEYVTSYKETL